MTEISKIFQRDINQRVANEGVARVWDNSALAEELREYVVTESLEKHVQTFLSAFVESMELRKKGQGRQSMGVWISGFFGSGKSHFAKILGHLLGNEVVDPADGKTAIDLFLKHSGESGAWLEIKQLLHEVGNFAWTHPILFEIKSKENLSNPNSIAEICLSSFYQSLGFSPTTYIARIESMLTDKGVYADFCEAYEAQNEQTWVIGRGQQVFNRRRIAKALQAVLPSEFPTEADAANAIQDAKSYETVTVEGLSDVLLDYLEKQRKLHPTKACHIVFVIDEVQQFIGEDGAKILELQSILENLGTRGKGQVWIVATGQEQLDGVIDRTKIRLNELSKMSARIGERLHLTSEDVKRVVKDRLLVKRHSESGELVSLYESYGGFYADLAKLNTERALPSVNEIDFCAYYPFLPHMPSLAQDMFDTMRGIRISGSERSMLTVTQGVLKKMAAQPVEALVTFDMIFDEIESEVANSDYLGANGVRAIRESDQRLSGWEVSPSRVLKVLWLAQRLSWIPRSADTLTKMLINATGEDIGGRRSQVEATLQLLIDGGYVSRDPATLQYKYLSAEEGEVEKAIKDKMAALGTGIALAMRKSKELAKEKIFTRPKLGEFRAQYGKNGLFGFVVLVDGEEVAGAGQIRLECYGPLSTTPSGDLSNANLAQGDKGKTIYWIAKPNPVMTERIKHLEALKAITSDTIHISGRSENYRKAIDEKRIEAEKLEQVILREIEDSFKQGKVLYSGEERDLDGKKDLKTIIKDAFQTVAPNVYDRFAPADKPYDIKALDKYLQSTQTKLDSIAPELSLFDSTGALITCGELVEPYIDEIKRREDAGESLEGGAITDHFEGIPFGWPSDLIRLLASALLRGGAIALGSDEKKLFDYSDSACVECLTKTTKFKKTKLIPIKTGLSPSQIQKARTSLLALGVTSVQESANDLARAIRQLATKFIGDADRVRDKIQIGLPLPDTYKLVETVCRPLVDEGDPTIVVTDYLTNEVKWKEVKEFSTKFDTFTKDGKDRKYSIYQRLAKICRDNGPLLSSAGGPTVVSALADMDSITASKSILADWPQFDANADALVAAYRSTYQLAYSSLVAGVEAAKSECQNHAEYKVLTASRQAGVQSAYFSNGSKLGIKSGFALTTLENLVEATEAYNLTSLQAIQSALPSIRIDLLTLVHKLYEEQMEEEGKPKPKVRRWTPTATFAGKTFTTSDSVDAAFDAARDDIKKSIADGFTVIVE
jgi:hypothetical protein